MHLWWRLPGQFVEVAATLEVMVAPSVPRLYFWALQVSFFDQGRVRGGAHLGLQAHPRHPGGKAVNWGGYRDAADGGGELVGSLSPLPSALQNANTRDFAWEPRRPYRLRIVRSGDHSPTHWLGQVTDQHTGLTTVVRHLEVPAQFVGQPVVWSEIFARCDHPSTEVRWSDLSARTADGQVLRPTALHTSYQSAAEGGCANTTAVVDAGAVLQVTTTPRTVPPGVDLPWT